MTMRDLMDKHADAENRAAMIELENRGFTALVHFGFANAAARLQAIDQAMKEGRLYEHMKMTYGI